MVNRTMRGYNNIISMEMRKKKMGVWQQVREKFIMKNAREDWTTYRDRLTDLIGELVTEGASENIAIVGAGRCSDIDLARLVELKQRVFLLDVDEDAMQEAVRSLEKDLQKSVECRGLTLTGISDADMDEFCEGMLFFVRNTGGNISIDSLRRELDSRLDLLEKKLFRDDAGSVDLPEAKRLRDDEGWRSLPSVDVLVCCGVYSQLFSMLSFFTRSLLFSLKDVLPEAGTLEDEISKRIRIMDDRIIPAINRRLYEAAGKAVVFGNEYMEDRPVEGAYQCIRDVREQYNPEERHLTWEFNRAEGITYDMLIQICRIGKT